MDLPFQFIQSELVVWAFNIGKALLILLAGVLLGHLLRTWLLKLGRRRPMNMNAIALLANLGQTALVILALILALPTFGVDLATLLTLLGTVGLAISLAAQDLLRNFI